MEQKHGDGFDWTPARVDLLKSLKARNYSAAQIAKQIGGGLTRNAVIGKLGRLGLIGLQRSGKKLDTSTDPVNAAKAKALDFSPPERLSVRRFSWEQTDAQANP